MKTLIDELALRRDASKGAVRATYDDCIRLVAEHSRPTMDRYQFIEELSQILEEERDLHLVDMRKLTDHREYITDDDGHPVAVVRLKYILQEETPC